jgi:hypothetical protein
VSTDLSVGGTVTATSFSGGGSALTALNAANIASGTLPVSRGGTGTTSSTGTGALVLQNAPAFTGDATFDTNTLKIDATNNRVGIGTASPDGPLHISKSAPYNGDTGPGILFTRYSNTHGGCIWNESNNNIDGLYFNAFLATAASTAYGATPKMVINSNGRVGVGIINPGYTLDVRSDDAVHVERDDNQTYETKVHGGSIFIRNPSTSGGYEHMIINNHTTGSHSTSYIQFRRGNTGNGGAVGTISGNGSTITYGGQSDYRVKENIVPMPISGLDTINNLQPKRFNFIGYPDDIYDGFIAHELQEHIPMAVTGEKDEMRGRGNVVKIDDESFIVKEDVSEPDHLEEGTKWVKLTEVPVYQNVDLSKVVTYLVKAVQELSEENRTLKTRLDAI